MYNVVDIYDVREAKKLSFDIDLSMSFFEDIII